jgi:uncharacterized protein (DUF1684 family)
MEIDHDVLQETMQLQSAQGSPASLPTVTEVEHMLQYAKQRLEVNKELLRAKGEVREAQDDHRYTFMGGGEIQTSYSEGAVVG